jgi:hypothetical protein
MFSIVSSKNRIDASSTPVSLAIASNAARPGFRHPSVDDTKISVNSSPP